MSEKALKDAGYTILGNFVYDGSTVVGSLDPLDRIGPGESPFGNAFISKIVFRKSSYPNKSFVKAHAEAITEESMKSIINSMGLSVIYNNKDNSDRSEFSIFTDDPTKVVLAAKAYMKFCESDVYGKIMNYSKKLLQRSEKNVEQFTECIKKAFKKEFSVKQP